MKRITYAGGSIVTSAAVADAILEFSMRLDYNAHSVSVEVPVLEANGTTSVHTLLLSPSGQFDVSDIGTGEVGMSAADGMSAKDEAARFPVPTLPDTSIVAVVPHSKQEDEDAKAFDKAVAELDSDLDSGHLS